eukprot:gene16097-33795_t
MLDLLITHATLPDGRTDMGVAVLGGRIVEVAAGLNAPAHETLDAEGQLLTPPFCDPHFHMDATLSYGLPRVNQSGTLLEGIAVWGELKPLLLEEALVARALAYGDWAVAKGLLAIRSHVDTSDPSLLPVRAMLEAKRLMAPYLDVQLVAFPQDGVLRSPGGLDNLKRALDLGVDVVGGIPHFERTYQEGTTSVKLLCELAAERGLPVDMHCDESDDPLSRHIETLDDRYDYDWLILRTALEKSAPAFGPFEMRQLDEAMSPPRVAQELTLAKGRINVLARATSPAVEQQFLPIRIPIDKGLLGLRVFLVRAVDLPRFAAVRSVQDLRAMRAGQGKDWADVSILRAAGIPVVEGTFERLYSMLMAGRFDFYSRGVDEAPRELSEAQGKYPGMTLEPSLLLEYPLPRYIFVRRDAEGERLARRITAGLESMVQDG